MNRTSKSVDEVHLEGNASSVSFANAEQAGFTEPAHLLLKEDTVSQQSYRPRKGAYVRLAITLSIGLGLIGWLLWSVPLDKVVLAFKDVRWPLLALGIVGNLLTPFLRGERFRLLYGIRGQRKEVNGLMGQYSLLMLLMPLKSGDIVLLGILKMRRIIPSIAEALPRWIVLRVGDLAAVLALILVTTIFVPFPDGMNQWMWLARAGAIGTVICAGIGLVVFRKLPQPSTEKPAGFLAGRLWALRRGLAGLQHIRALVGVLTWSLVIWAWHSSLLALEFAAFNLEVEPGHLWMISVAILATSILPIHPPLAIGTLHAVQVGLLQLFDIPLSIALATAIGIHAAMIVTVVAQGLLGTALIAQTELKPE